MDRTRRGVDDAGQLSHPAITGQPGLHSGGHIPAGAFLRSTRPEPPASAARHLPAMPAALHGSPSRQPPGMPSARASKSGDLEAAIQASDQDPWRATPGWSHHWQLGGPMLVAEIPSERSHDHDRRLLSIRASSRHKLGGVPYDSHS
jgi:hypothetical protein